MTATIRSGPQPRCLLCGSEGAPLYHGLGDRLFGAPGIWSHRRCVRADCGLVWLDPMPAKEDIHLAYARYYTHVPDRDRSGLRDALLEAARRGYLSLRFGYPLAADLATRFAGGCVWLYPGRAAELDFSVMWLPPRKGGRLLDVGAGNGRLVAQMGALGWRAEGLDFDAAAVADARARGLTMHQGSLVEQGFAAGSLDAVTMSHSIEHVHDPVAWLAEARRLLAPGGRLVVATPNSRSLLHRRFGADWFALDPPRHLQLFCRASLAAALRAAGFERMRLFTSVRDANGAWIGSRAIRLSGRHDMTAAQPAASKVLGRLFQLAELATKAFDPDAGEDLVAIAER